MGTLNHLPLQSEILLCFRFHGLTCATCLVRSCMEDTSQTTGTASFAEPTLRYSWVPNRWGIAAKPTFKFCFKCHCSSMTKHYWYNSNSFTGVWDVPHYVLKMYIKNPSYYDSILSLMESWILLLGLPLLPIWTTLATMPTLMKTSLQRAPTSMVSIPMPRLASSPLLLKTSSAQYLRCSQGMHLWGEGVVLPGRRRCVLVLF